MIDTIDKVAPVLEPLTPASTLPEIQSPVAVPEDREVTLKQSRLDDLIRKAQGRAGSEARAEAFRLKRENELLKAQKIGNSEDSTEVERLRAQVADEKLRADRASEESAKLAKQAYQERLNSKFDLIDHDAATKLLQGNLKYDPEVKDWVATDDSGVTRLNTDGTPMSGEALYAEFAATKKHFVKGTTIPGTGASGSHASRAAIPATLDWRKYVGPQSDASKANALAQRDPRAYQEMKRQARAAGVIV